LPAASRLAILARMTTATEKTLAAKLDAALPQTQCTRCGYPRCRAYAEAIARGDADINQCPPGGVPSIRLLAQILGVAPKPLDTGFGVHVPRRRAVIDEGRCIGCRKCLEACPVDAIVGAHQRMHTVIAAQCSGCELCLPPCPVDCIDMVPVRPAAPGRFWPEYADPEVGHWRDRTQARLDRLARRAEPAKTRRGSSRQHDTSLRDAPPPAQMRAEIRAAIARVRARRGSG
jgi:H+/Na+-translocating ferredoxin:NAD+ oxidoreductase subunit B